jgi:hypothetical protein
VGDGCRSITQFTSCRCGHGKSKYFLAAAAKAFRLGNQLSEWRPAGVRVRWWSLGRASVAQPVPKIFEVALSNQRKFVFPRTDWALSEVIMSEELFAKQADGDATLLELVSSWVKVLRLDWLLAAAQRHRHKPSVGCARRGYINAARNLVGILPKISENQPHRSRPHHQAARRVRAYLFRAFAIDACLAGDLSRYRARNRKWCLAFQWRANSAEHR